MSRGFDLNIVRWRANPVILGLNVSAMEWYKRFKCGNSHVIFKYEWLRFLDQIAQVLSSAFSHSWHTCNQKLQELGRRQYRACCGTSHVISSPSLDQSLFPCWNPDRTRSTPTTGVARTTRWGRESQSTLTAVCVHVVLWFFIHRASDGACLNN